MTEQTTRAVIIQAYSRARANFKPIVKNKRNPHFKNAYADLDSIYEATLPALQAEGFELFQPLEVIVNEHEGIEVDAPIQLLHTKLYYKDGTLFASSVNIVPLDDNAQKVGSYITYMRRYSYAAMLGLTADEDNDGGDGTQVTATNTTTKRLGTKLS